MADDTLVHTRADWFRALDQDNENTMIKNQAFVSSS